MVPRAGVLAERVRSRLWPIPALAAVLAGGAAGALSTVRPPADASPWWFGDPSATRGLLEVLTGSSLTVVALVLSLQVVALQLAATQYSPRLLRTYVRDGVIQAALSVLIATFVFSLVTLALFGTSDQPPRLSVALAVLLGLASVGALMGVVAHIVASLRIETMMAGIHTDAQRVIDAHLQDLHRPGPLGEAIEADVGVVLRAHRSGFVQTVDRRRLAAWASRHDARIELDIIAGDHVLEGDRLGRAVGTDETPSEVVVIGFERTPDDDPAYGLLQLSDIAVRALSPGVNDPTTAVHAIGHLSALLSQIVAHPLGRPRLTTDDAGQTRLVEAQRDLSGYLDVAWDPVLRAGAAYPRVLLALVRMLDVAARPGVGAPVLRRLERLGRAARTELADPDDLEQVLAAAGGVPSGSHR